MSRSTRAGTTFQVRPIGYVHGEEGDFRIEILEQYRPALTQLELFSHVMVFWWATRSDNDESRNTLTCRPPYATDRETGVFACRAEYRPNPIMVTTCAIMDVDVESGIVTVPWIDAAPDTPVIDLKAYFPISDRVKSPSYPEWLSNWPMFMPEEPEDLDGFDIDFDVE